MPAVVVLLVSALAGSCTTSGSPSPEATSSAPVEPSPTGAPVTGSPAPSPSATAAGPCMPAALAGRVTGWTGAAGSRIATVELRSTGEDPCAIFALARPQLVDGAGSVLIEGEPPGASAVIEVPPGGVLRTEVRATNYCGPDPVPPLGVAFTLPEGLGRVVASPDAGAASGGLPPCLGPATPGTIEMQPWAP